MEMEDRWVRRIELPRPLQRLNCESPHRVFLVEMRFRDQMPGICI